MKPLHQLLLGAGLLGSGPAAEAQQRTDYVGTWLNTAAYPQSVVKLEVSYAERWAPSLVTWEGLPANALRRELGFLWSRTAPDGTATRLGLRRVTAGVSETYLLDLHPDGALWVLRHVGQAGQTVRCDTMRFERRRGGVVSRHDQRLAARRPPAPPEVALCFTPIGPPIPAPPLLALQRRTGR